MSFFDKLLALFRIRQSTPTGDDKFEELVWLEPHENPFGVRVLDLSEFAARTLSATENPLGLSFFGSAASQSGSVFRGRRPDDARKVACSLEYSLTEALPEGPLFLASEMEDKWNIYHFDGVLYFARSWNGDLHFVAQAATDSARLSVVSVEAWPGAFVGGDSFAIKQVDFLIKSHVFNQVAPHPVPLPSIASKQLMATLSFMQYGRRGLYALPDGDDSSSGATSTH